MDNVKRIIFVGGVMLIVLLLCTTICYADNDTAYHMHNNDLMINDKFYQLYRFKFKKNNDDIVEDILIGINYLCFFYDILVLSYLGSYWYYIYLFFVGFKIYILIVLF